VAGTAQGRAPKARPRQVAVAEALPTKGRAGPPVPRSWECPTTAPRSPAALRRTPAAPPSRLRRGVPGLVPRAREEQAARRPTREPRADSTRALSETPVGPTRARPRAAARQARPTTAPAQPELPKTVRATTDAPGQAAPTLRPRRRSG